MVPLLFKFLMITDDFSTAEHVKSEQSIYLCLFHLSLGCLSFVIKMSLMCHQDEQPYCHLSAQNMAAVTASPALCTLTANQSANYLRVLHSMMCRVLPANTHTSAAPSLSPGATLSESWSLPEAAPPQVRPLTPPVLASSPLVLASSNDLYLSLRASASSSPADSSELLAKYACCSIGMFTSVYKTGKCN